MSDMSLDKTESPSPIDSNATDYGSMEVEEVTAESPVVAPALSAGVTPVPAAAQQRSNRLATVEHLASRRTFPELDAKAPGVKEKISELRTELTTLVTDLRWGGQSIKDTAERIIPSLNVGPLQQWIPIIVPNILEIDRAGDLVSAWLNIIEQEDPIDLPADANPAETMIGRARRIAILMLGYYKTTEISEILGRLATDPRSSLYATRSLVRQSTLAAIKALAAALKDAEGWAKVDVIDAFATLNQARFYEIMLASGLDDANGLESYIAVPLFRPVPLENYLREERVPRLAQQAALICAQVFQDNTTTINGETLPVAFDRDLPTLATALFDGARRSPNWRSAVALHRLGLFLGRYWGEISRGTQQDIPITLPVMSCLQIMPSTTAQI